MKSATAQADILVCRDRSMSQLYKQRIIQSCARSGILRYANFSYSFYMESTIVWMMRQTATEKYFKMMGLYSL